MAVPLPIVAMGRRGPAAVATAAMLLVPGWGGVVTFQNPTVGSASTLAIVCRLRLNASPVTGLDGPVSAPIWALVSMSHSLTTPSPPPLASSAPCGLKDSAPAGCVTLLVKKQKEA